MHQTIQELALSSPDMHLIHAQRPFESDLLLIVPQLRAFGRFLAKNPTEAEDLVQDTLVRALRAQHQFSPGTNLKAWTFTILRNLCSNLHRARKYESLDECDSYAPTINPNQQDSLELKEVLRALAKLPPRYREVITLVRASGLSYEEAAAVTGCKLGTIKSRLNRADIALRAILGNDFRAPRQIHRNQISRDDLNGCVSTKKQIDI